MHHSMEFAAKMASAYSATCKPLCQELKLPQTALDILLFLANNPDYKTASDIVEIRKIKANLVSVNVEKLVKEGYLKREAAEGDRRKVLLLCTDRAMPVIRRGRALQQSFFERLFTGTKEETRKQFLEIITLMGKNLDSMLEGED